MIYQLSFYVGEAFLAPVKKALFSAGAGEYGRFKQCAWETLGRGQYQMDGEALVEQSEYKVEILCREACLEKAIQALKETHPCEDPVYYLTKIDISEVD